MNNQTDVGKQSPEDAQTEPTEPEENSNQLSAETLDPIPQPPVTDSPSPPVGLTAAEGQNVNQEEAMKMLQAIRDRDLARRIQKQNKTRRRYRPADRDW